MKELSVVLFGGHETEKHGILRIEWSEVVEEFLLALWRIIDLCLGLFAILPENLKDGHAWLIIADIFRLSRFICCSLGRGGRDFFFTFFDLLPVLKRFLFGLFGFLFCLDTLLFPLFGLFNERCGILIEKFHIFDPSMVIDNLFLDHHHSLTGQHVDIEPVVLGRGRITQF